MNIHNLSLWSPVMIPYEQSESNLFHHGKIPNYNHSIFRGKLWQLYWSAASQLQNMTCYIEETDKMNSCCILYSYFPEIHNL